MGEILIRQAILEDAPAIARVGVDSWRTTYAGILPHSSLANLRYDIYTRHWRDILTADEGEGYANVAQNAENGIVGFILGGINRTNDRRYLAELYAIHLLQEHQLRGSGRLLVGALAGRLWQQGLISMLVWVQAQNPARTFYEALGGKLVGARRLRLSNCGLPEVAYGWKTSVHCCRDRDIMRRIETADRTLQGPPMTRKIWLSSITLWLLVFPLMLATCTVFTPSPHVPDVIESKSSPELPAAAEPQPSPTETQPPPPPTPSDTPPVDPQEENAITTVRTSEKDGMVQIYIPAGEFIMGWQGMDATLEVLPGPFPDFLEHRLYLDGYWIDKYTVTNGQYQRCVAAGACRPCGQNNIPPQGTDYFTENEYADYPVVNVSWYMGRDYCAWVGRRLPTEAEWEKAARGTDGRKYPWGNEPYTEDKANICDKNCPPGKRGDIANPNFDDGYAGPAPVGSYPAGASPYRVMDMAGNVWEWTSTAAEFYPYDPHDGRENLYDIAGGEKWPERILRGGPWSNGISYQRSSFRYRAVATYWNFNMGFRCAADE